MSTKFNKFLTALKSDETRSLIEAIEIGYKACFENSTDDANSIETTYTAATRMDDPIYTITFRGAEEIKKVMPLILQQPEVVEILKNINEDTNQAQFNVNTCFFIEISFDIIDITGEGYSKGYAAQWNVSPEEPAGFEDVTFDIDNIKVQLGWDTEEYTDDIEISKPSTELYTLAISYPNNDSDLTSYLLEYADEHYSPDERDYDDYDDRDYDDRY